MAFLRVKDTRSGEVKDVALRKPLVLIGRAEGNDVLLDDPTLAPTHANLLRKGNHFTVSVIDRANTFMFQGTLLVDLSGARNNNVISSSSALTLGNGILKVKGKSGTSASRSTL